MRLGEFLTERAVESSWIVDMRYAKKQRIITLVVSSGRVYTIPGTSETLYKQWMAAPSKGRFYHQYIRGKFKIWRVR